MRSKATGFGSLALFAVAVGFAAHLLRAEPPAPAGEEEASAARVEATAGPAPVEVALSRAEKEPAPPAASTPPVVPPSIAELEDLLAADPNAVLKSLAQALPRGEREAQLVSLLEVRALVARGNVGTARARARGYFERWPSGPDIATLEALTGVHPTGDRGDAR